MTGDALQRAREAARLSRAQLADLVGVHRTTVFRWETGAMEMSRMAQRIVTMCFSQTDLSATSFSAGTTTRTVDHDQR